MFVWGNLFGKGGEFCYYICGIFAICLVRCGDMFDKVWGRV